MEKISGRDLMFCSNCGKEIVDDSNFCSYCGVKIESNNNQNNSETPTPSFIDEIHFIRFQIPEGFETIGGVDNEYFGTGTRYYRIYSNSITNIRISVSSPSRYFRWDLSRNRHVDDVEKTINGFKGVFVPSEGIFKYLNGKKLVVISGATDEQLQNIIIKKRGIFG